MKSVANIVSYIFHPLLLGTYLFTLLAWALPSALNPIQPASHRLFLFFIFLVTFVLPLIVMSIFKVFGTIQSFEMRERKERIIPFIFILSIYVIITYMFYSRIRFSLTDNFMRLLIIIDLLLLVCTIATLFFKVSIHSIAIWGLVGIIIPLNKIAEVNTLLYPSMILILLAGVIMSSRLYLNVHTSREVMWGSVLGLATSVAGMIFLF